MKILIIGTNRFPHYALMDMGHQLTMIAPLPAAFTSDLSKGYHALHFLPADHDTADIVALAIHLHRLDPFDAVVTFHDGFQAVTVDLCHALSLKSIYEKDVILRCLDKVSTREYLRKDGLTRVSFARCETRQALLDTLNQFEYPCIIKPLDGTGSVAIHRFDDLSAALTWWNSEQADDEKWIVESFINGKEYSVEAMSSQGKHRIIAVTEKYKRPTDYVEIGHIVPAILYDDDLNAIEAYVLRVLDSLNIVNGPTHTELMLTEQGPEIIETHTRMGGDRIPQLVKLACGVDIYHLTALQAIGDDLHGDILSQLPQKIKFHQSAAIAYSCHEYSPAKVVSAVTGAVKLSNEENVIDVHIYKPVGSTLGVVKHSFDRSAHVIITAAIGEPIWALAQQKLDTLMFGVSDAASHKV